MIDLAKIVSLVVALVGVGCGVTPPVDDGPPPGSEPCGPSPTDEFALGVMVFENPRWFKGFDEGCRTLEVQSGLQGGWHVEPAVQAPLDVPISDLGGELRWKVTDSDGDVITNEARFEMFRNFWQELEGGNAYWGDFVIFTQYPEEAIGTEVTVELTLDFDDRSTLEDKTISETVTLLDDE